MTKTSLSWLGNVCGGRVPERPPCKRGMEALPQKTSVTCPSLPHFIGGSALVPCAEGRLCPIAKSVVAYGRRTLIIFGIARPQTRRLCPLFLCRITRSRVLRARLGLTIACSSGRMSLHTACRLAWFRSTLALCLTVQALSCFCRTVPMSRTWRTTSARLPCCSMAAFSATSTRYGSGLCRPASPVTR